jgi:hypothetical protein
MGEVLLDHAGQQERWLFRAKGIEEHAHGLDLGITLGPDESANAHQLEMRLR